MALTLPVHTLTAFNTATASENKIHDDEVAAALGFGGGLVPGVDVYAYLTRPAVAHWGPDLLGRGRIDTRFGAPVYDGERIEVRAEVDDDGALHARVHPPAERGQAAAALLDATIDDDPPPAPTIGTAPRPAAGDRAPASPETLPVGLVLGTFAWSMSPEAAAAYLDDVRDPASPVTDLGAVHPGALLRLANDVLSQTVVLGPWMHVGSTVHNYAPVAIGEQVEVRGVVTDNREHKGHRFVEIDAVVVGPDGSTRTWIEHTAIYEPRQLRAASS